MGGWTVSPKGFSGLLLGLYKGKKLIPIGRVGTGFPQKLLRWLEPRLKQLEIDVSPFAAPIPRKPGRAIHYAKPELVAGIEMTSWTDGGVVRQASLQEVRERTDKSFRPDWINLPGGDRRKMPGRASVGYVVTCLRSIGGDDDKGICERWEAHVQKVKCTG